MCAALLSCSGGAGSAYEKYSISTDAGLDSALLSLKTNPSDYLLGDAILRYCTEKGYFDVIIDGFPSVFRHAEAEGEAGWSSIAVCIFRRLTCSRTGWIHATTISTAFPLWSTARVSRLP